MNKILLTSLALALTLTVNFTGNATKVYANDAPKEKVIIENVNGLISNDSSVYATCVPDNWNPINATDEELRECNFPDRLKENDKLKIWKKLARVNGLNLN